MKQFVVMSTMSATMNVTNQKVSVIELSEVKYMTLPTGKQVYTFDGIGEKFVIDQNSQLAHYLISHLDLEAPVDLNLEEFNPRNEKGEDGVERIFYHKSVNHP